MMRSRGAGKRSARAALLFLALAALAGACAPPPHAPPRARALPGYDRLRDDPAGVEARVFRGRRVAIDPGHGGFFPGSIGVHGTTEAAVNLGVALELRRLLEAAGATVVLTREADRDFLTPADSSLRSDLNARVKLLNDAAADVVVSIHHNADPAGRHDVNETVTYYKLGDDGPSLDLAESVHRALVRNVGIPAQKVSPGNFAVIRGANAPAILTETSYLTHPKVEARIRRPEKQRLEAEALFLGLAHYFARRVPVIERFARADAAGGEAPPFEVRVRGAFDDARIEVDGEPLAWTRTADGLRARSARALAPDVPHVARARVRLAAQGSSPWSSLSWSADTLAPIAGLDADVPGPLPASGDGVLAIRIVPRFSNGARAAARPHDVRLRFPSPGAFAPAETTITCVNGVGWAYVRASVAAWRVAPRPEWAAVVAGRVAPFAPLADFPLTGVTAPSPVRSGFALDAATGAALRPATPTRDLEPGAGWINRDGFVVLPLDSLGDVGVPDLAGYRAVASDTTWPPRFVAIAGGALHGRRIVLDPDGGGDQSQGVGASGARGSGLALAVCRALAAFLRAAGADVRLTRDGDASVSDVERVQISEAFRADRFLRVGFRNEPAKLGHYFSSAAGRAWAGRTRAEFERLGLAAPPIGENAQYPITQTSCVAMAAMLGPLDDAAVEERLLAPGALRARAYALFLGLAHEFAPAADWPLDSLVVRDEARAPVAGAAVRLGTLVLESDAFGVVKFARTEPGAYEAAVDDSRVRARGRLLDSAHAFVLTGPRGR